LALQLNKIEEASVIAEEQESVDKWKKVGDIALMSGYFELAEKCFDKSQDYNSLLLFYSSYGDEDGLRNLADNAEKNGKYNVALEAAYLLSDADRCIHILLKSKRVAEAAMFARAYAPSKVPLVMKQWEESLK
jgi:coatomer subunit beta'